MHSSNSNNFSNIFFLLPLFCSLSVRFSIDSLVRFLFFRSRMLVRDENRIRIRIRMKVKWKKREREKLMGTMRLHDRWSAKHDKRKRKTDRLVNYWSSVKQAKEFNYWRRTILKRSDNRLLDQVRPLFSICSPSHLLPIDKSTFGSFKWRETRQRRELKNHRQKWESAHTSARRYARLWINRPRPTSSLLFFFCFLILNLHIITTTTSVRIPLPWIIIIIISFTIVVLILIAFVCCSSFIRYLAWSSTLIQTKIFSCY